MNYNYNTDIQLYIHINNFIRNFIIQENFINLANDPKVSMNDLPAEWIPLLEGAIDLFRNPKERFRNSVSHPSE